MLIAQMDGLELLPDPSELVQGAMAFLLLTVPLLVVVGGRMGQAVREAQGLSRSTHRAS